MNANKLWSLVNQNAQYCNLMEGADDWRYMRREPLKGNVVLPNVKQLNRRGSQGASKVTRYIFIVRNKCTECKGFHDEPQVCRGLPCGLAVFRMTPM